MRLLALFCARKTNLAWKLDSQFSTPSIKPSLLAAVMRIPPEIRTVPGDICGKSTKSSPVGTRSTSAPSAIPVKTKPGVPGAQMPPTVTTTRSLQIKDEGAIKSVTIYKANELPEGSLMRFKMEPFDTGLKDEDGDAVEVWLAGSDKIDLAPIATRTTLTKNQQTMFAMLLDAGSAGLTSEEWNDKAREAGIGASRRADLYDNRRAMQRQKLIHQYVGRWFVDHKRDAP